MQSPQLAVIGATGTTGRRIVERLTALGHDVRPLSRRTTPRFDWDEPSAWPDALAGVRGLYVSYYPDLVAPQAPAAIEALTAVAREAGVERIVLLAGRGEAGAQRCEDIVRASGIDHTVVRASWFAQNFTEGQLHESVLGGVLALPAGDVVEPFVDADDIADVAVAALTEPRHGGRVYELTGPRLLSFDTAAQEISAVTGAPLAYVPIDAETFRQALTEQVGAAHADLLTGLCVEVFDGRNESLGRGVQEALGREPRDFADVCRAAAAAGAWA
ncbi:NmrA family NAD(P)-binding protein [Cellulomonas cellasea]|uniref:NmrA family NAD(P)-binding protein n=1 Tax=Cellulomonas cellasea TaxID=43670 RepID=UPI0025A3AF47|nr:NmrA family NAD(P)-binding protein [Cellulomonas cellasea]MDM8084490.1 NmrA family NAD(P)-binding protein [Cellulomonas cellasea]